MPVRRIGKKLGGEPGNFVVMVQEDGALEESIFLPSIVQDSCSDKEYIEFIAAIFRSGLEKEGPEYLQTPGGQFWCRLGGLAAGQCCDYRRRRDVDSPHAKRHGARSEEPASPDRTRI